LWYNQRVLRGNCSVTNQIDILQLVYEKSWEYTSEDYARFVNLKRAYDPVLLEKLRELLRV